MANISAIKLPDGVTYDIVDRVSKDVFVAIYGESSFAEVNNAIGSKQIYLSKTVAGYSNYYPVSVVQSGGAQLDLFYISRTGFLPASTSVLYHASITSSDVWSFEEYPLQPKLVSGTNIKTINSESLLGSGNITVGGDTNVQSDWNEADSTADDYIKNKPTNATTSKSGLMSSSDKAKLNDIASGATNVGLEAIEGSQNIKLAIQDSYGSTTRWELVNKTTIPSKTSDLNNDVPFATTNTATTSANGLMSSTDKSKLDGIESGAEVNYVTNITQHFIADPNDSQYIYPRSATLDYNAVGINDVELLTKDALGKFNGVCDLDASSKVPKSRLSSTSTPTADELSEFDSNAHMNSTDMTAQALETYVDSLDIQGSVFVDATEIPTAGEIAKFDSTANMSSTDMTTGSGGEVEAFVNGLNVSNSMSVFPVRVYASIAPYNCTTANTMQYTGVNVTIPADSFFAISARATYNGAKPLNVAINDSSTNANANVATGAYSDVMCSCSYISFTSTQKTFYLWAKYATVNTSAGSLYIDGWYIKQ